MKCSRNGRDFGFSPLYAENLDSSSSKTKTDLLPSWRETCHGELLLRFSFVYRQEIELSDCSGVESR
ncbi:hypothetical protein Tco_1222051 [Tanacetum coccineum]